jgi:uncharacterized protein (TIGR00369 family)
MKSIWKTPLSVHDVNERAKNTLSDHLKISFTHVENDSLTARMPITRESMQPMGIMHGGATAALAETVGSAAANYCVDQSKFVCVGLDLNINHLRPMHTGHVDAIARPLHLGKTTQVWDIRIHDPEGKLVSVARLTMMVLTNPSGK